MCFAGTPWLSYDNHFRRNVAATRLQDWSHIDPALWSLYFSSAIPKKLASADLAMFDRSNELPNEGAANKSKTTGKWSEKKGKSEHLPYERKKPICIRWNKQGCNDPTCDYRHWVCLECHEDHPVRECPIKKQKYKPTEKGGSQDQSFRKSGFRSSGGAT